MGTTSAKSPLQAEKEKDLLRPIYENRRNGLDTLSPGRIVSDKNDRIDDGGEPVSGQSTPLKLSSITL